MRTSADLHGPSPIRRAPTSRHSSCAIGATPESRTAPGLEGAGGLAIPPFDGAVPAKAEPKMMRYRLLHTVNCRRPSLIQP